MALDKEHYMGLGRNAAQGRYLQGERSGDRRGDGGFSISGLRVGSWQFRAWVEAYQAEMARLTGPVTPAQKTTTLGVALQKAIDEAARLRTPLVIKGPLYPSRTKGRSKRGWTSAAI